MSDRSRPGSPKRNGLFAVRTRRRPSPLIEPEAAGELEELLVERISPPETGSILTGGDVDADWQGAESCGDEAVGGSAPTPDQSIVDEIGCALGVEQASDAEVYTSEEILRARDRHYWHLEREAAEDEAA